MELMDTGNYNIDMYLKELSSKSPIPGGGGASALAAALSAALSSMVCNLTIGKKSYAAVEKNIRGILDEMQSHIENFIKLADKDAEAFYPLSQAYSVKPKTTEEKLAHEKNMEELLYNAATVPFELMKEACWMMGSVEYLAKSGSKLVISDVGVAVALLRSSVCGAMMNVAINTKYMKDRGRAEGLLKEGNEMLKATMDKSDIIYKEVLEVLL